MNLVAAVLMTVSPGLGVSGDGFDDYVKNLNDRIEAALAEGREWPKFPGGLSGFLFDQHSVVGKGAVYYVAAVAPAHDESLWRKAAIVKLADGTWRPRLHQQ